MGLTSRLATTWRANLRGKLVLGCGGLLAAFIICTVISFAYSLTPGARANATATARAQALGAPVTSATVPSSIPTNEVRVFEAPLRLPSPTDTPRPANTAPPPTLTDTPKPPATVTVAPTLRPTNTSAPSPVPLRFSGVGQQVSPKFTLPAGLAIFRMKHQGASNFAIVLLDNNGNHVDLLVNEIGSFEGSKVIGVKQAGTYLMNVDADGSWTVNVEQPNVTAPVKVPATLKGRGQQASQVLALPSGLVTFRMTHNGKSNFAIVLLDGMGNHLDLLVNEIGLFNGAKAVGIRQAGAFILDIDADGDWTVSIE